MIDKSEMKRIDWVIKHDVTKSIHEGVKSDVVLLYEDIKRDAVRLYDEVVKLQKDLEKSLEKFIKFRKTKY